VHFHSNQQLRLLADDRRFCANSKGGDGDKCRGSPSPNPPLVASPLPSSREEIVIQTEVNVAVDVVARGNTTGQETTNRSGSRLGEARRHLANRRSVTAANHVTREQQRRHA